MQIDNSSSCVTEVNSPVRDLLTGFERQNNSLSTLEGQGRDITEEKDLSEETSRERLHEDRGLQGAASATRAVSC